MANITTAAHPGYVADKKTLTVVGSGSGLEVIGGGAALVLGILGLLNISPMYMAPIAAICAGAGILAQGGSVAARYHALTQELMRTESGIDRTETGGGIGSEIVGGLAGIVLGVLALLSIVSLTLLCVAAIVLGATLVMSSGAVSHLNTLAAHRDIRAEPMDHYAHQALNAAAGAQVMVGLGSVVLGILALMGTYPLTLVLISMLAIGCSVFLSGSALGSRILTAMHNG